MAGQNSYKYQEERVYEGEVTSPSSKITQLNTSRSFSLPEPEAVDKRRTGFLGWSVKKQDQEAEDARIALYDATVERIQAQRSLLFAAGQGVVDSTTTLSRVEKFGTGIPEDTGTKQAFQLMAERTAAAVIVFNDDYNQTQHATNLSIISRRRMK